MSKRSEWVEQNQTQQGVKMGLVDPSIFMNYVRYTEFLSNISKGMDRGKAIVKAADYLGVHRTTVLRAVTFFEDCA